MKNENIIRVKTNGLKFLLQGAIVSKENVVSIKENSMIRRMLKDKDLVEVKRDQQKQSKKKGS